MGQRSRYGEELDGPGFESRQGQDLKKKCPDLLWAPPSPLFNGYQQSFPGIKRLGRELEYSFPSSAQVKNEWSYTAAPHIRLHGENDNCTFTQLTATSTPKHSYMLKPMSLWR
jgi:hypothetical protein